MKRIVLSLYIVTSINLTATCDDYKNQGVSLIYYFFMQNAIFLLWNIPVSQQN